MIPSHKKFNQILSGLSPKPDRIFFISDANVAPLAGDYLRLCREVAPTVEYTVPASERAKSLEVMEGAAYALSNCGATRRSLVVAVGGGVVTDLGGFLAALFKRGVRHINVATTILAAVDAAIGGKTAIDFAGLKNEIGAFHLPVGVVVASELFSSLPWTEWLSGSGEVLKTGLLDSRSLYLDAFRLVQDASTLPAGEFSDKLGDVARRCAAYKEKIVEEDPTEKGIRRLLNLGHTFGHAFESLLAAKGTPLPHGVCVAHGILPVMLLSEKLCGFDHSETLLYRRLLTDHYPALKLGCPDLPALMELLSHDKKSTGDAIAMALLEAPGSPVVRSVLLSDLRVPLELSLRI